MPQDAMPLFFRNGSLFCKVLPNGNVSYVAQKDIVPGQMCDSAVKHKVDERQFVIVLVLKTSTFIIGKRRLYGPYENVQGYLSGPGRPDAQALKANRVY